MGIDSLWDYSISKHYCISLEWQNLVSLDDPRRLPEPLPTVVTYLKRPISIILKTNLYSPMLKEVEITMFSIIRHSGMLRTWSSFRCSEFFIFLKYIHKRCFSPRQTTSITESNNSCSVKNCWARPWYFK